MSALLDVEDLRVAFVNENDVYRAVDGLSFDVNPGEIVAMVGESGSGKSVTAMTILGLTRGPGVGISGRILFDGLDLIAAGEPALQRLRGAEIAIVFQDPLAALNPVQRIGTQIIEQVRAHERISRTAARARAVECLARVGIPSARERLDAYPHEFSGGMRQRVMIAMALSCSPRLLIADEPTTGLDVTVQAQILAELDDLRAEMGLGVLLVTHDLGVVADIADRVVVMYAGRAVERAPLDAVFDDPQHPYTWGLLGSIPRTDAPRLARLATIPGQPPLPSELPKGCAFAPRCPHRFAACAEPPPLESRVSDPSHHDRCWLPPEDKRVLRDTGAGIGLLGDLAGAQ
jgi:peptide/nickel transport system ATP-binding protein